MRLQGKQLARGRQLPFPTARSTFLRVAGGEGAGGRQQDAVGEKWHGGPTVSLGQDHRAGQSQVGLGFFWGGRRGGEGLINY